LMLASTLTRLLVPLVHLWSGNQHTALQFELRHLHAVSSDARVVFSDVSQRQLRTLAADGNASYTIRRTAPLTAYRPPSFNTLVAAQRRSWELRESAVLDWDEQVVQGPDTESRETLLVLAKMANNAYVNPDEAEWYDLGANWTTSYPFGWEPDTDGFRGHVFATPDNSTIVVSIKGTSTSIFGGGGPTAKKDKLNDNLLFSCCCARIDWTWTTVCGCYRGGYKCDQNCVEKALVEESLFYPLGTNRTSG